VLESRGRANIDNGPTVAATQRVDREPGAVQRAEQVGLYRVGPCVSLFTPPLRRWLSVRERSR
jgi:hypothetical protein